jgi:hypothetical protein
MIIEDQENAEQTSDKKKTESAKGSENIYKVQCFPLYSMLVAVGRTRVDYFSLDVEGSEYKILATIPWHKVDIKVCISPNIFNGIPDFNFSNLFICRR